MRTLWEWCARAWCPCACGSHMAARAAVGAKAALFRIRNANNEGDRGRVKRGDTVCGCHARRATAARRRLWFVVVVVLVAAVVVVVVVGVEVVSSGMATFGCWLSLRRRAGPRVQIYLEIAEGWRLGSAVHTTGARTRTPAGATRGVCLRVRGGWRPVGLGLTMWSNCGAAAQARKDAAALVEEATAASAAASGGPATHVSEEVVQ
jgi:hypothetical protein